MPRYGTITAMPDVSTVDADKPPHEWQYLRAPWTYFQGWSGVLLDGQVVLYGNGGGDIRQDLYGVPRGQLPEEEWALVYPLPDPLMGGKPAKYWDLAQWHRLYGPSSTQHETGLVSIVRTPASWPDDKRWLLLGSCSGAGTWGTAYRVFIGIATSYDLLNPFVGTGKGITSRREFEPPPDAPWYPPGMWCVAALTVGERVLVIGYDPGAKNNPKGQRTHVTWELHQDFTYELLGEIHFDPIRPPAQGKPYTWLTDAAIGADGRLYALDGGDPGQASHRHDVTEYASAGPWAGEEVTLLPTGRVFSAPGSTALPDGGLTWDAGYLRTPEGEMVGDLVLANGGTSADPWTRGNWWLQWWTEDADMAGLLGVEVEPVRLGPVDDALR